FLALLPRIDLALSAEHQNHKSLSKLEAPAEIVPRRIIARGTKPSGASSGLMWSAAGSVTSSIQRSHLPSILPRYTLTLLCTPGGSSSITSEYTPPSCTDSLRPWRSKQNGESASISWIMLIGTSVWS